jgi:hypothetical protein
MAAPAACSGSSAARLSDRRVSASMHIMALQWLDILLV